MGLFIGIGVFLVLLMGLLLWSARRSYKSEGSHPPGSTARQTRLKGQEDGTRWGAGT